MKFIDEVVITVQAGKGGDGCLSFRREKFIRFGGPNGGDGGDGGSIYLHTDLSLNTLVDFRFQKLFKAKNGQQGFGSECTGRKGDDLVLKVPVGTMVFDNDTGELLYDLTAENSKVVVAKGGHHGLGNIHFKSSRNQAPRKVTEGHLGEMRNLRLELKLLADVGLLGLPNAGKSTFIRAISAATPKVADYPFTTLFPSLGVVRVNDYDSFVVADIPGIIRGASHGAGLGLQFLRHLQRTKLLLHLVDVTSLDAAEIVDAINTIENELKLYSPELAAKPRWLVFNKIDAITENALATLFDSLKPFLPPKYFLISGFAGTNTTALLQQVASLLTTMQMEEAIEKAP